MYWMFNIFGLYAVTLIALMAGYFGILATLIGMTGGSSAQRRALATACFAVAVEWLRGDAWYLRFPWYTPPHALAQSPAWIAPSHWIGAYGLSFVVWGIAALTAFGKLYYALPLLALPACSFFLPSVEQPTELAILVQVEESYQLDSVLARIPYERVDLMVLPEYAYPMGIDGALRSKRGPAALAKRFACPVVFGTVLGSYGEPGFQNVAAVLDAKGNLMGTFPKQRPVPLMVDGLPGKVRPVFRLPEATLGIGLCYDFDAPVIAAALVASGATVLLAPTGDLMSWGSVQHLHHELLVRLRAVENDRWVLRATTSGRSEAISPHGHPSKYPLEIGETGSLVVAFSNRDTFALGGQTHYLGPIAAGITLLFILLRAWMWWKARPSAKAVA